MSDATQTGANMHATPRWYPDREVLFADQEPFDYGVPIMTEDERERRWTEVRAAMEQRSLDGLLVVGTNAHWGAGMANVRYLTQIASHHSAEVIFPLHGDPLVLAGWPHASVPAHSMAHTSAWVTDIAPREGMKALAAHLRSRVPGRRLGLVGYSGSVPGQYGGIAYGVVEQLLTLLPGHELVDATDLFDTMRLIKSDEEISLLEQAASIARSRVDRLAAEARPGATEAEVWSAMHDEQMRLGGESQIFNMLASGPTGDGTHYQHLLHGVETPQWPTTRRLSMGDLIVCEFHTQYAGYQAHTEFSVVLGQPPAAIARLHAVSMEYLDMVPGLFVPGRTIRSVIRELHTHFGDAGLDWVELGFHGHGLMSPEFPTAVYREADIERLSPAVLDFELREGMVFGTNADPHDPSWRRDVGVMFGDTVHVTADGGRLLVDIPRDLLVV